MPFFLTVLALLAIWILYVTIRMGFDPKYREEQIAQAKKGKNASDEYYEQRYNYWYDQSYNTIHGIFKHSQRDKYAHRKAMKDIEKNYYR